MGNPDESHFTWPDWVGTEQACSLQRRCFMAACVPGDGAAHDGVAPLAGIAEDVSWASMADLGRHMAIHRRTYGATGVDAAWWVSRVPTGRGVRPRALAVQLVPSRRRGHEPMVVPARGGASPGRGVPAGRLLCRRPHPRVGPDDPGGLRRLVREGEGILLRALPAVDQRRRLATCWSWLLDDQLADWLPPESNIVRFQRRFELVPGSIESDGAFSSSSSACPVRLASRRLAAKDEVGAGRRCAPEGRRPLANTIGLGGPVSTPRDRAVAGEVVCGRMRAFLFDIDGTLVDSSVSIERVWRQVAREFGVDEAEILQNCHGRRDVDVAEDFFKPEVIEAVLARVNALDTECVNGAVPVRGARQLLATLDDGQWAAVTSGPWPLMAAWLQAAGLPVPQVLITAEDVHFGKPHPEGSVAAEALGLPRPAAWSSRTRLPGWPPARRQAPSWLP